MHLKKMKSEKKNICPKCKLPFGKVQKRKSYRKQKKILKSVSKKASANPVSVVVKTMASQNNTNQRQPRFEIGPEVIRNALVRLKSTRFLSTVEEIADEIKKEFPELSGLQLAMDVERKMRCACEAGIAEYCSRSDMYRLKSYASAGIASSVDRTSMATEAAQFWECCNRTDTLEACRNKRLKTTDFDPFARFDEDYPFRRVPN